MDLVSHAALGAACAHLVLGRQNKKIAWKVGALAALVPDLDILIAYLSQEPLSIEYWHRNFTHSLIFIPFGALLFGCILMLIPSFRKNWRVTFCASLIGMATHGFLDACTSYGTMLLWPWDTRRYSWDVISIIDPLFTIILVLGTAWSVIFNERKAVSGSLICAGFFLLFNTYQHHRALETINEYAAGQGIVLSSVRAMPYLASSTHWRIIAGQGECFFIANVATPLWGNNQLQPVTMAPRFVAQNTPFSLTASQKGDIALFSQFTDGFVIIAQKNPLILADGRYTLNNEPPIRSLWGILISPKQIHVKRLKNILINEQCTKR